jgi:hypothetical protein
MHLESLILMDFAFIDIYFTSTTYFVDDEERRKEKKIKRPAVLNAYFSNSGLIDRHNHLRQGELRFEK